MKPIIKLIFWSLLLYPIAGLAQLNKGKTATNVYNFSEVWVWEYSDVSGTLREIAIYREPTRGYWLLTPDDSGFRDMDGMSLWFMLKPNGEIIQAYQDGDEQSPKKLIQHRVHPKNNIRIPRNWRSTGKTKKFGDPELGVQQFTGREYEISYAKTNDRSVLYLGSTSAFFGTLALFNELNIDAKLPINFPDDIPGNLIPLSEKVSFAGGGFQYTFKYISPTEYNIDLSSYKKP